MLDARAEIDRLRQKLKFQNMSESAIDNMCDSASKEIGMMTADILADAMIDAVQAGANIGSVDLIQELRAVRSGPTFDIATQSGRTDFSEPPFPMLPKLLKNAKAAKDGSLYKVIPMKKKGSGNRMAVTTEAAIENINAARRLAKEQRDADDATPRGFASPDALRGLDIFAAMQEINKSRQKAPEGKDVGSAVLDFRTASSKQDPASTWVIPEKKKDAGVQLRDINMNLHADIDRVIEDVIKKYEGTY